MTTALSWLNDLAQWLGRWIPRLVLIEPTHRGVLFGPKGSARQVGPGLVLYWPITHELVQVPVTTQSIQLTSQVLPAADARERIVPHITVCAVAIQFRVTDAVRAATKVLNLHALVDNRTSAAIARYIAHRDDPEEWADAAVADLRRDLQPFGVAIERMDFTQLGTGIALKNMSDWTYGDNEAGTRPKAS
jgi:regulator of protease activity HflC (stomatin/prohibitin superfamily)